MTEDRLCPPYLSPLYISLIDLTNTLQIFYYKIYVLDDKHANNYYWFISIQLLLFLLYTRIHSSLAEYKNISSKIELKGNSTKKKQIIFLKMRKIKCEINVVSIFPNHDLLVNEKSISNKWEKSIAKTTSPHNIYLIGHRYDYLRFHGNVRNPCEFDIYLINVVGWAKPTTSDHINMKYICGPHIYGFHIINGQFMETIWGPHVNNT